MKKINILLYSFALFIQCTNSGTGNDIHDDEVTVILETPNFIGDFGSQKAKGVDKYNAVIRNNRCSSCANSTTKSFTSTITDWFFNTPITSMHEGPAAFKDEAGSTGDFPLNLKVNLLDSSSADHLNADARVYALKKGFESHITPKVSPGSVIADIIAVGQPFASALYNYSVNAEFVHTSLYPHNKSLNLLVMAEGYRDVEITTYRTYVQNAFANDATFQSGGTPRHFYSDYWNRINVIRLDTISLDSGVDLVAGQDNVRSILGFNNKESETINQNRVKRVIHDTINAPGSLLQGYVQTDFDAIIVLVNDPTVWAVTSVGNPIENRNGQPIHYLWIQAPVSTPSSVVTWAIGHELGHALAKLQDEYIDATSCAENRTYEINFRNIDDNLTDSVKWQFLINAGYGADSTATTGFPAINPIGYLDPNPPHHLIGGFQGGFYCSKYFRPTMNAMMNNNVEFGPVDMYNMMATFLMRIGDITAQDSNLKDVCLSTEQECFKWISYPISGTNPYVLPGHQVTSGNFLTDWPPSKF